MRYLRWRSGPLFSVLSRVKRVRLDRWARARLAVSTATVAEGLAKKKKKKMQSWKKC